MGLNLNEMKKTEKNMTELNIEKNLSFELSNDFEKNKLLKRVENQEIVGLKNIGNHCYANVIFQVLL